MYVLHHYPNSPGKRPTKGVIKTGKSGTLTKVISRVHKSSVSVHHRYKSLYRLYPLTYMKSEGYTIQEYTVPIYLYSGERSPVLFRSRSKDVFLERRQDPVTIRISTGCPIRRVLWCRTTKDEKTV